MSQGKEVGQVKFPDGHVGRAVSPPRDSLGNQQHGRVVDKIYRETQSSEVTLLDYIIPLR